MRANACLSELLGLERKLYAVVTEIQGKVDRLRCFAKERSMNFMKAVTDGGAEVCGNVTFEGVMSSGKRQLEEEPSQLKSEFIVVRVEMVMFSRTSSFRNSR